MKAKLWYTLIFFLCILIPNSASTESIVVDSSPMHNLIPFTSLDQLARCDEVFDLDKAYEDSLQCSSKVLPQIFNEEYKAKLESIKDSCYVILAESPDVYSASSFNYIREYQYFGGSILGFYDPRIELTYLVDNVDVVLIGRHEFQHHFLRVLGIKEGDHTHEIWTKCEPPRYTPSKEAREDNPYRKH